MEKQDLVDWISQHEQELLTLAKDLWKHPELGLDEGRSAQLIVDRLQEAGFTVEQEIGGMPTAFVARYGDTAPTIGILGEYDALPGLSQSIAAEPDPIEQGGPGHGCGHNLFAVGSLGGALAIKQAIEDGSLEGTICYFGCPAEEIMVGKIYMARAGVFDDLDAALSWHPGRLTTPWLRTTQAYDSIEFSFDGTAAHAAKSPDTGRSALDAVQLMNTGAEYIREHIPTGSGFQYTITQGGDAPNPIPASATVWYTIRGANREQMEAVTNWLIDIAEGAAQMTQTTLSDVRYLTAAHDYLPNDIVTDVLWENMQTVDPIEYTEEEREFAAELLTHFEEATIDSQLSGMPDDRRELVKEHSLYPEPIRAYTEEQMIETSTDVADVSWITPTGQFWASAWPVGAPGHTWPVVAANGSFGLKSAVYAAKVFATTGFDLLSNPELLERAREAHGEDRDGRRYESPLPADAEPPEKLVEHSSE